jgi:hypothetical protein
MFDTRLAYQIVEWERRIDIENEKHGINRPVNYGCLPAASEPCHKPYPSIVRGLLNAIKTVTPLSKSSEPAVTFNRLINS